VTLKSGLRVKVIENGTIRMLGCGFLLTFHSSLTIGLCCIISEIKQYIGRKSRFFNTPLYSTPPLEWEYLIPFITKKLDAVATLW